MNLQILTLCDAANSDSNGKLNILGSFDQIMAVKEPLTHPYCCLAAKIRFDKIEEGKKTVRMMFVDTDGKEVFPAQSVAVPVKMPANMRTASVLIIAAIPQLTLPHFGEYQIDVAVDGLVVGSVPLFARQWEPPD